MLKFFLYIFLFIFFSVDASDLAPAKDVFKNISILSCGKDLHINVYSSLDAQALLDISNVIFKEKIPLTADWDHFKPPSLHYQLGANKIENILDLSLWPKDIARLLTLCLVWNEVNRSYLFELPGHTISETLDHIKTQRPWKTRSPLVAQRIDNFSDKTLKEFVELLLRVDAYLSARGGLEKNPSLSYIPFEWRVPVE